MGIQNHIPVESLQRGQISASAYPKVEPMVRVSRGISEMGVKSRGMQRKGERQLHVFPVLRVDNIRGKK